MIVALSPLAERFLEEVAAASANQVRLRIEDADVAFARAAPELAASTDRRHRLGAAIDELVDAGVITRAQRSLDRRERPHLPTFIKLVREAQPPRISAEARSFGWRRELAWAATLSVTAAEFALLRSVQEFLKNGGADRPVVPLAERSLELTGDEKAIGGRGRLFAPGRLTIELLRAERASPPFVYRVVGNGPVALVVENAAAYRSVLATRPADSPIGVVVFGSGRGFATSVAFFADLRDEGIAPTEIRYFGDLDRWGLEIPADASVTAQDLGLPPIRPAVGLYASLLRASLRQQADPLDDETADELIAWLPSTLRASARELLVSGVVMKQESVGTESLAADMSWATWAGLGPHGGETFDAPSVVAGRTQAVVTLLEDVRGPDHDAERWVAASRTRNWLLGDPLLDWLKVYGHDAGFVRDDERPGYDERTDFRRFVLEQGHRFEDGVVALLERRAPVLRIAQSPADSRSRDCARATRDALAAGAPIVSQGVLHDDEAGVFGMPDLLIRSDVLAGLFPEIVPLDDVDVPAPALATRYHYRVVDVKLRTFSLLRDGHASEAAGSLPFLVQVWLYNQALGRLQGFEPPSAYLLGRNWTTSDGTRGLGCLDRLARVDADRWLEDRGASLAELAENAIAWVRRVGAEGSGWQVLPEPSVPEMYPHMRAAEDAPWHGAKAVIGAALRELTLLPRMNPGLRRRAHAAGILRWDDPAASSTSLGVTGTEGAARLDVVLSANRSPVPAFLPESLPADAVWRTPAPLEFFVDLETVSNLSDDFTSLPEVGGWAGIFQIGCGWLVDGSWQFAQWTADRLEGGAERVIIDAWVAHMEALASAAGVDLLDARIFHWSPAEGSALDTAYNAARVRHGDAQWPELSWFDLLAVARAAPMGVTGAFGYSLKQIAKAMAMHEWIETTWGDGPTDGLGAMVGAWWCDAEARLLGVPMGELLLMREIATYNQVDCRVLAEILAWLRENR